MSRSPSARTGARSRCAPFRCGTLASGSTLNVSGGVTLSATGQRTYGNGGSITIQAGNDPNVPALIGGSLQLGATLAGFSGARGGALSLQAPRIQIGGGPASPETLQLTAAFFNQGGFASFSLTALGARGPSEGVFLPAISIATGTTIEPVVQSLIAVTSADDLALRTVTLPPAMRPAVSLAFNAQGVRDNLLTDPLVIRGDFVLGAGAAIRAGVLGNVSIAGDTAEIAGSIDAPAGAISISGALDSLPLFAGSAEARATVHLGSHASLTTAGATLFTADRFGRHTGIVLPGGTISVAGNLVAEELGLDSMSPGASSTHRKWRPTWHPVADTAPGSPIVASREWG